MESAITVFLFVCVLAMFLMAAFTRSLGGAFLGLALVALAVSLFLFDQGGLSILGGIGMGALALVSILLTFGLGVNLSHSSLDRYDRDGTHWHGDQTVLGEGAKQSYSHTGWNSPQIGSGDNFPRLGDGR